MSVMGSIIPKDIGNLANGVPTYGIFEYLLYLDDTFYTFWMAAAETNNLGLGFGLMITSLVTKLALSPITLYSQMIGHKMKLLEPDTEDM